ncbi:MAG: lamin tail domain-containing protein [Anaerolineales bacterium]
MKSRWRLFSYLLINIFVSAIVVGTVLFFYNRAHRPECPVALPDTPTVSPGNNNENINIIGLIGAGTITQERMVIQNAGTKELILTGWYLADNKGLVYIFPQLMLAPGAKVQVHTTSGKDTPTDLYWGRSSPVWISGELVALYDTNAIVRAFYRVP